MIFSKGMFFLPQMNNTNINLMLQFVMPMAIQTIDRYLTRASAFYCVH